ncbi:hypothetical protein ASQ49_00030 [Acidipropionibacterium acidipropionici]|nr:hypothetical protein ASQ49_00030 [Acidipropionibacterium acidipropionici]
MRSYDVEHREEQRLHPEKPLRGTAVETESHQFVKPGHEHSHTILPETENLGGLGIELLSKVLRVEAVSQ